jgi:hypothetical protein
MVCGHEYLTLYLFPGLREYFSQTDEIHTVPRIPVMHTMVNAASMKKDQNLQEPDSKTKQADNKHLDMVDEESEDDDDYQVPDADVEVNVLFYSEALKIFTLLLYYAKSFVVRHFTIKFHCTSCTGRTYQI